MQNSTFLQLFPAALIDNSGIVCHGYLMLVMLVGQSAALPGRLLGT